MVEEVEEEDEVDGADVILPEVETIEEEEMQEEMVEERNNLPK